MDQIVLENVSRDYRVGGTSIAAVKNASLSIGKGAFASIVGHSGSGKTTLLSLIGGMVAPSSGRVLFNGTDITAWDSDLLSEYRCERIGFMFQSAFRSRPAETGQEGRAEELLRAVGLGDKIDAYPAHLSGGQQRRVAIARSFMNGPELILADEPTGDLDEETENEMMQFFLRMNQEHGTTFVMVTHNSDLARQTQQHYRMDRGVISAI
jgi:ABC-type lipoprotein export system ATPase subunit